MNLLKLIQYLRDRLKAVIWVCCGVLALVVVLDAIPAVVDKHHAHTAPEHWPGFWAVFGFVACVAIIIISVMPPIIEFLRARRGTAAD